ncbi:MAG: response regulator [Planctomycetota bacterium]|nr:MAG: response regulator [Planctomycetota bacterium]
MAEYRILIADDSEACRSALAGLLQNFFASSSHGSHHMVVELVDSGSEALQRLLELRYDLSLLDVHMPRLTGLEVIAQLQSLGRQVPSILMTGHPSRAMELAALEAGAIAMLRKPIPAEILRLTIQQVLISSRPGIRPGPGDQTGDGGSGGSLPRH